MNNTTTVALLFSFSLSSLSSSTLILHRAGSYSCYYLAIIMAGARQREGGGKAYEFWWILNYNNTLGLVWNFDVCEVGGCGYTPTQNVCKVQCCHFRKSALGVYINLPSSFVVIQEKCCRYYYQRNMHALSTFHTIVYSQTLLESMHSYVIMVI